ncbi:MAG TPA: tRNA pseudouridine(38-40) synthase TruA [Candidatus Limnocylindria bacterium]|nr:tRNA pseudouridine(38-40) synthase TruA [Candidatus Limnocylindria bacterium]
MPRLNWFTPAFNSCPHELSGRTFARLRSAKNSSSPAAAVSDGPVEPMLKFRFLIAYDGANYEGWQMQKTGLGVQQCIEEALQKFCPGAGRVHGSSRTDTGVHALGMVAHFEVPRRAFKMSARKLLLAINSFLPEDIRVLEARRAPAKFHARFNAKGKQYRYFVWNHTAMNPLQRGRAWHVPVPLDFEMMKHAAKFFVGKHDFKSFAVNRRYEMASTVRTVTRCEVRRRGRELTFIIEGDGFLYKMCRGIVGTIVQAGQGKFPPEEIKVMLDGQDRRLAGMTAPAHGLVLWRVFY